jgi:hypothetical protein
MDVWFISSAVMASSRKLRFVVEMPIAPDPIVWMILLGACKAHGDVAIAEVTKKLNDLEPSNSGNYMLLSNTYASAERWGDVMTVRLRMVDTDGRKSPAYSVVDPAS